MQRILGTLGKAIEVPERLMDAVTGLSASGPAYVSVIIEALADGGVRAGLTREIASQLAMQTVYGTAKMLLETGLHPAMLKDMVASPGGTTIAGLHALERGGAALCSHGRGLGRRSACERTGQECMNRTILSLILNSYLLTLLLLSGGFVALVAFFLIRYVGSVGNYIPLGLLAIVLLFAFGQMLLALKVFFGKLNEGPDEGELAFPPETLQPLPKLVTKVSRQRKLQAPNHILISGTTAARVQDEGEGARMLVLGGPVLALISERLVAFLVVHQLAHFDVPGSSFLSKHRPRIAAMNWFEHWFRLQAGRLVNPFFWLLRGYHGLAMSLYYTQAREHELNADRLAAKNGKELEVAAALVAEYVIPEVMFYRTDAVADIAVKAGEKLEKVFTEQYEKVKGFGPIEWENAFKKALRREGELLSSRPSLKERLQSLGVSPKQAFDAFQKETGAAYRDEMEAWPVIERKLIKLWIEVFRNRADEIEIYGAILSQW